MQKKIDAKSNEITAMPVLLDMLDLEGVVVSMDAMGAQRSICEQIIDRGGDYVVGLKGNQKRINDDTRDYFNLGEDLDFSSFAHYDKGHGRIEKRVCRVTENLEWLHKKYYWPGLKTIVEVQSTT